jgi:abortive infection bacteriophage resistance protein
MKFDKPALSFEQQLDRLIERGLQVDDRARALHYLSHINYYRLAGYLLPFEQDHASHTLRPGTTLNCVLSLYNFDRELRLLVLDAMERIEVSLRTAWAYYVAHSVSPHGYLDHSHAGSSKGFAEQLGKLERDLARSSETFVKHHRGKYTQPDLPPIWAACEVMSLGQLSRWYELLHPAALRKLVAKPYGLDQQVLASALHHLTYVRNLCAHHARLWNREFVVTWKLPNKGLPMLQAAIDDRGSRQIYNSLCLVAHLMTVISPSSSWRRRLADLIDGHQPDLAAMGMPADWRERTLWREGIE